jgi:hypothetical protein
MIEKSEFPEFKFRAGIDVPEKWEFYVRLMLKQFQRFHNSGTVKMEVHQVKEKFGSLRVYYEILEVNPPNDWYTMDHYKGVIAGIVNATDLIVTSICTECGSTDDVQIGYRDENSGWMIPLCKNHRASVAY